MSLAAVSIAEEQRKKGKENKMKIAISIFLISTFSTIIGFIFGIFTKGVNIEVSPTTYDLRNKNNE